MATNTLSDKAIRAALKKATEAGKPITINDGDGLSLIARPDGAGWWRLRYWLESRENRLSLGTYPDVSLADARARRDAARKLIAAGTDPRRGPQGGQGHPREAARSAGPGGSRIARPWHIRERCPRMAHDGA